MNMTLKPCPFCGGEASVKCEVFAGICVRGYWVSCDNDNCNETIECRTYAFDTEAEAIAAWNHRAERTRRTIDNGAEPCRPECDCRHSHDDGPESCMGCGARVVG